MWLGPWTHVRVPSNGAYMWDLFMRHGLGNERDSVQHLVPIKQLSVGETLLPSGSVTDVPAVINTREIRAACTTTTTSARQASCRKTGICTNICICINN